MFPLLNVNLGPSWRFHEAERCLRQKPVGTPRCDDSFVKNYIKVAKSITNTSSLDLVLYKLSKDPVLAPYAKFHYLISNGVGAKKIGENNIGANFTRSILDALALCDTDPEDIAELTGVDVKTIEIYETLMFDVRDKPEFWTVSHILSPIINSFSCGNFDAVLKFAAVALGRNAVDQLLFKSALNKDDIQKLRETVFGWRLIKSAASSVMIPVSSFNNLDFERDVNSAFIDDQKLTLAQPSEDDGKAANRELTILESLFGESPITISSKYRENKALESAEEEVVSTNLKEILTALSNDVVREEQDASK